jgi:hypothetical protein
LRPLGLGGGNTKVKLTRIKYKGAYWIHLPSQLVQWRDILSTTIIVQVTWKAGDVFISRTFISLIYMKIIMAYEQLLLSLFCTVHVVTFTLYKTNSCTSFKHTFTSTF